MKKYTIILLFLTIFLVWCNINKPQSISFEQASDIFFNTIKDIHKSVDLLSFDWSKFTSLDLEIFWENRDFKLKTNIFLSGIINYSENENKIDTNVNLYFWDKNKKWEYKISWNISNIAIDDNVYLLFRNPEINLGTWNYQWELMKLIAKNLENKWIKTKISNELIKKTKQDMKYILNRISSWYIFELKKIVSYEWDTAYKIDISQNILQDINSNTNIHINTFKWLLIVRSASKVELKIEELNITNTQTKNSYIIKWFIDPQKWLIKLQQQNDLKKLIQVSWKKFKKHILISIDNLSNNQKILWLDLKLYPQKTSYHNGTQINWILSISPLIIYWSDLEKDVKIDINGLCKFEDIQNVKINKPDSYILLEQILWDEYSLEAIMKDNNG